MFLSSAFHDKPPRKAGPRRAAFSRNRRKRMNRRAGRGLRRRGSGARAEGEKARTQRRRAPHGEMEECPTARRGAWRRDDASRRPSRTCSALRRRTREAQAAAGAASRSRKAIRLCLFGNLLSSRIDTLIVFAGQTLADKQATRGPSIQTQTYQPSTLHTCTTRK